MLAACSTWQVIDIRNISISARRRAGWWFPNLTFCLFHSYLAFSREVEPPNSAWFSYDWFYACLCHIVFSFSEVSKPSPKKRCRLCQIGLIFVQDVAVCDHVTVSFSPHRFSILYNYYVQCINYFVLIKAAYQWDIKIKYILTRYAILLCTMYWLFCVLIIANTN